MDLDEINWMGVLFGIFGMLIGIIIAKKMGSGVPYRLIVGALVGVVCYFVGGKIVESG